MESTLVIYLVSKFFTTNIYKYIYMYVNIIVNLRELMFLFHPLWSNNNNYHLYL